MIGLITYLGSSPRRLLAVLVISAAAVAAAQFSPLLHRSTEPVDVGAQSVSDVALDNPRVAQIFEPRPIPARAPDAVAGPESTGSKSPGLGQAQDPPVTAADDAVGEVPVSIVMTSDTGDTTVESLVLRPTAAWVNVFGDDSTINGEPLHPGDVVTAFDPDGTLIGRTVVEHEGSYGLMALYMDDPATSIDEGAEPGDVIRFQVNGLPAVALGPHAPVWTDNGAIIITNIAAAG